jgi:hypothetical protein
VGWGGSEARQRQAGEGAALMLIGHF